MNRRTLKPSESRLRKIFHYGKKEAIRGLVVTKLGTLWFGFDNSDTDLYTQEKDINSEGYRQQERRPQR